MLGDRLSLKAQISQITGIIPKALEMQDFSGFSFEERMSWRKSRQTTRPEDSAYCLLGIFGIFMLPIYGEGRENAFRRLRHEFDLPCARRTLKDLSKKIYWGQKRLDVLHRHLRDSLEDQRVSDTSRTPQSKGRRINFIQYHQPAQSSGDSEDVQDYEWTMSSPPASPLSHQLSKSAQRRSNFYNMPPTLVSPKTFVQLCVRYCRYTDLPKESDGHAKAVAVEASRIFGQLIKQQHKHTLIVLNIVLTMLVLYQKKDEALQLMAKVRELIAVHLPSAHPLVRVVLSNTLQAAGDYGGMSVTHLTQAYDDFRRTMGKAHPNTLIAGYLLAWTKSLDNEHKLEALQLLDELQRNIDAKAGPLRSLYCNILNTKTRIQHSLRLISDALATIKEARRQMRGTFRALHPYTLDARTRYGMLLFANCQDDKAEMELVAAALGRAEVFGTAATLTQESVRKVEDFLFTVEQHKSIAEFRIAEFHAQLAASQQRHAFRTQRNA